MREGEGNENGQRGKRRVGTEEGKSKRSEHLPLLEVTLEAE